MARSAIPRFATLFGLLVLFCGFVVIVAGLASIQKKTNSVSHMLAGLPADQSGLVVAQYNVTYSAALLAAYPARPGFQYSYIWFIIFFNLFNFLLVSAIVAVPRMAFVGRNAALALVAVAVTLTITVVNNLAYLHQNDFALQTFGKITVNVTYAGAILVAIGDLLIILALGMWERDHPSTIDNPHYAHKHTAAGAPITSTTTV